MTALLQRLEVPAPPPPLTPGGVTLNPIPDRASRATLCVCDPPYPLPKGD